LEADSREVYSKMLVRAEMLKARWLRLSRGLGTKNHQRQGRWNAYARCREDKDCISNMLADTLKAVSIAF
jgi:hypothetical protein